MRILVFLQFLVLALSEPVTFYRTCNSTARVISLDITPCNNHDTSKHICQFPRGHNVTVKLTFIPTTEVTAAKPAADAYINSIKIPVPVQLEQDSCDRFESPCPLAANVLHGYTSTIFINPSMPQIKMVNEGQLRDQNDQVLTCIQFPLEIV